MKLSALFAVFSLGLVPAFAQVGETAKVYEKPYWIDQPVIEILGRAKLELSPNRGQFSVRFIETDRQARSAMRAAVERGRSAYQAIKAVTGDAANVSTSVFVEPYYEQYRDRDGDRVENRRADKVIGYEASVSVDVLVETVELAGAARAAALALAPEESDRLRLYNENDAETLRQAYEAAVNDGAARAVATAEAANATLGHLLVVQEGRGPCLGRWIDAAGRVVANRSRPQASERALQKVTVTASQNRADDAVSQAEIEALNLPSDRPVQTIEAQVCMIYAIGE